MKTRHIFERGDFSGGGHMIVRESSPKGSDDISFMASVAYKVGYGPNAALGSSADRVRCTVAMNDGRIVEYANEAELIEKLNNDAHGYRPMSRKECIATAKEVGNRWPKKDGGL